MTRILVIDDEDAIARLISLVLRRTGVEIATASSAAEALERLAQEEVAVVVSDLAMPGMSGLELARRLETSHPRVRMLVVSAMVDPDTERALEAQANVRGIVRKPFDVFELAERVGALLERPEEGRAAAPPGQEGTASASA
jgi:CheY-like chemotaxis protein